MELLGTEAPRRSDGPLVEWSILGYGVGRPNVYRSAVPTDMQSPEINLLCILTAFEDQVGERVQGAARTEEVDRGATIVEVSCVPLSMYTRSHWMEDL